MEPFTVGRSIVRVLNTHHASAMKPFVVGRSIVRVLTTELWSHSR